ncbi:MAG TPA: MFS transporter [Planctomycetota bacterium]|nr:MFS transporter [Planctomycetota bacterium]
MSRNGAPTHTPAFRNRRTVNWLSLGLTYSAMYMARYNLSFANASLSETYGWKAKEVGAIITSSLLVYGLSAMFNGPIVDRIGGRRAMLLGAAGAAVCNVLFALGSTWEVFSDAALLLGWFAGMWSLNCYFQSFSAVSLIKVNAAWFHVRERGVFSGVFGSMIQLGRAGIYAIAPLLLDRHGWTSLFYVGAAVVAVFWVFAFVFVRDTPEHAGHAALDVQDATSGDREPVNVGYLLRKILLNRVTLAIAVAEFCTGVLRHGFEQWFPRYMKDGLGMQLQSPVFQKGAAAIVIAGILGALSAGTLSDWLFKQRRAPMAFVGYLLSIASLFVVWKVRDESWIVAAFVVNSFGISVVHSMLSGTASMDFGGKRAAGTAAGIFDGMQYVGGAATGVGIGALVDRFTWGAWAPSMISFAVIGAVLMWLLRHARPKGAAAH